MNVRLQIIVAIAILFALGVIINMIRKRALDIIFVLTVAVSRMSIRIKELTQELALHEKENRDSN